MDLSNLNKYIKLEIINCEWAASQSVIDLIKELRDEINELEHEINKGTNKNHIAEEMADVFSDVLLLIHIAERDQVIDNKEDIFKRAFDKKMRRKGWVWEGKKLSQPEASKLWHEAKRKEKEK